jgi:hypothetical protein
VRLNLYLQAGDGETLSRETVELATLPAIGTMLRPPTASRACFVTRALPATLEDTGDLLIAGTIYADVVGVLTPARLH